MTLPDRITTNELEPLGFIKLPDGRARHIKWQSWRSECSECGIWCKHTVNGKCKDCGRQESLKDGRPELTNFLIENRANLSDRHYIIKSDKRPLRWAFTVRKVVAYQKSFGNRFCLITARASAEVDCFIFPFWEVEQFFSTTNIVEGRAWKIYINHGKVWFEGVDGPVFDPIKYYNAIEYLDFDSSVTEPTARASSTTASLLHETDIIAQIAKFNAAYADVAPTQRITVSRLIERPGHITDHVKQLNNYTCQLCKTQGFEQAGGGRYIEAHHLMELHAKIPGSYCSDNIVIVCANCHNKLHFAGLRSTEVLAGNLVRVVLNGDVYEFSRNLINRD